MAAVSGKLITELKRGKIRPGESQQWSYSSMLVPEIPPSSLDTSSIIEFGYILQLNVHIKGNFIIESV